MLSKTCRGMRRVRFMLFGATILAGGTAGLACAQPVATPPGDHPPSIAQDVEQRDTITPTDSQVIRAAPAGAPVATRGQRVAPPTSAEAPAAAASGANSAEIVVTGFRRSLTDEANAKRLSTNFTDSVFAEDIGKFPDLNIAESLQRIPGVQLSRDVNGEGTEISIRGLGPSFVKVLLNGSQIAVASDGSLDQGASNREVDLDLFPTELFTKLSVAKTPVAETLEGGISGTVNLVNVRPFDDPGQHVSFSYQEGYGEADDRASPRGSLIASKTWGDAFGVLVGVAGESLQYRSEGYETIGYTTPKINCSGCDPLAGKAGQGGGFSFANIANAGLSAQQLSSSLFPRLARDAFIQGSRDRYSTLLSSEWRPLTNLHFTFDGLYSYAERDFNRLDEDLALRNSSTTVPSDVQVNSDGVVTSATLANSQYFLEARPYRENVTFYNLNPQFDYRPLSWIQVDGQVDFNKSVFHRSDDSYLFNTPANITTQYNNPAGAEFPQINQNVSLNNPNLGYTINSFRIQPVRRDTEDKGAHLDFTFGDASANIKVGYAYDDTYREIVARDNSSAANSYALAHIATASIPALLTRGPSNILSLSGMSPGGLGSIVAPNYAALTAAANTAFFEANAPFSLSSATATPSGVIDEKTNGAYIEANGVTEFFERKIHWDAGVRYFSTDQEIIGPVSISGKVSNQTFSTHYDAFLPSFNAEIELGDHLLLPRDHFILRLAGSRSITRANPNSLLPGTTFSDPSAQEGSQGNPNLKPYFSNNADLGLEYYFMGSGYLALDLFAKDIDGFTALSIVNEPFGALGIPLSSLNVTQLATGITNNTIVSIQTTENIGSSLGLRGAELTYSQPLDFVTERLPLGLKGFGFTGNYTHVEQSSSNAAAIVLGIARNLYTLTGYYENYGFSLHVSYNYIGANQIGPTGQNNTPYGLFADPHGQVDLSASYTLPFFNKAFQVVFNAINLNNEPLRTYFGFDSAPYSVYYPGSQYLVGLHAHF